MIQGSDPMQASQFEEPAAPSPSYGAAVLDTSSQAIPLSDNTASTTPNALPPRSRRTALIVSIALTLFLVSGVSLGFLLFRPTSTNSPTTTAAATPQSLYRPVDPPAAIKALIAPDAATGGTIALYGQVQITGGLILTPTTLGQLQPILGELYFDKTTNQLYYYNGTTFVGTTGSIGLRGPTGANGSNGQNGSPGVKGDKGDTGPQGLDGNSADAILNQTAVLQAADFRISGTGVANILNGLAAIQLNGADINTGGTLSNLAYLTSTNTFTQANTFTSSVLTPLLDTNAATVLNLGTTNATQISANQNTIIASNKSFTANGAARFQDATNSSSAFQIQNAGGNNLFTIDSTDSAIVLGNDGNPSDITLRGATSTGNNVQGTNLTFAAPNGTGAGGSGNLIFQTSAPQTTPVTVDTSVTGGSPFSSSLSASASLTVGVQSNRLLMVEVGLDNAQSVATVTYNGVALTRLHAANCPTNVFPNGCDAEVWYMAAPPTGTHTLTVTLTGSDFFTFGAISLYNVDQTTPFGTAHAETGTSPTISVTIPSQVSQMVMDFVVANHALSPTTGASQTVSWTDPLAPLSSYQTGQNGSTNMTWTLITGNNTSDYADYTVPINQIPNTTPDPFTNRLVITGTGNVGINNSNPQHALDVSGTARIQTPTNSTAAFQIQDAGNTALFTADTMNMKITVSSLIVSTTLTVNGHIVTTGTNPTIAAGAAACTSPTVSVTGTDTSGKLTITTGTGCSASGQLATITFADAYATAPQIVLSATNAAGAQLPVYNTSSTGSFAISTPNTPANSTSYTFSYHTLQ